MNGEPDKITINWSETDQGTYVVKSGAAFHALPMFGDTHKWPHGYVHAGSCGYYHFFKSGKVVLDTGVQVLERPEITFIVEHCDSE